MIQPVLEVCGVSKSYNTGGVSFDALRAVDLSVQTGDFLAIMGPSGCGKSTLLHLMGALDTPSLGQIRLGGRPLDHLDDAGRTAVRRNDVGFVFQFFNLVPVLTVAENIALPAVVGKVPTKTRLRRLEEVVDEVGLRGLEDRLPTEISGGQQQRVAIARALFNRPALILADEPTGNLDHTSGKEILALFCALHAGGQTVVIVTHDPAVAAAAQRVVFLHDGQIVADVRPAGPRSLLRRLTSLQPT